MPTTIVNRFNKILWQYHSPPMFLLSVPLSSSSLFLSFSFWNSYFHLRSLIGIKNRKIACNWYRYSDNVWKYTQKNIIYWLLNESQLRLVQAPPNIFFFLGKCLQNIFSNFFFYLKVQSFRLIMENEEIFLKSPWSSR